MDTEKLKALTIALEKGSITRAAEALNYTPSAISRIINSIELELGLSLIIREHNGIRATKECEELLPHIYELLHIADAIKERADKINGIDSGTIAIGNAYSAFYTPLSKIISMFHDDFPNIKVELISGYSTELLKALENHQIDFAIISKREGEHNWLPILDDEMVAWLPAANSSKDQGSFPIEEYTKEDYIETFAGSDIDNARVFKANGIRPNIKFSTRDSLATYKMVEAGLGVTMHNALGSRMFKGSVIMLPLNPPAFVEIGIATLEELSPAASTFYSFLYSYLDILKDVKKAYPIE